jgi:hypothetical protein
MMSVTITARCCRYLLSRQDLAILLVMLADIDQGFALELAQRDAAKTPSKLSAC